MNNYRQSELFLKRVVIITILLAMSMLGLKLKWHEDPGNQYAVLMAIFFASSLIMTARAQQMAAARNLPRAEDLPASEYQIRTSFYQYGRTYYDVVQVSDVIEDDEVDAGSESWLVESRQQLPPPPDRRPLPAGHFPNQSVSGSRFAVRNGEVFPVYGRFT
jgi:hypothetical protein